ncbi:TenA family protein [Octadecabacter ascidiaceicola]|uniref:Aminopyrimidine aminohydrolase n=1 Tax=Octadecabacter ascidiaceicola TaxID=1655543 RepID=A0A238K1J3_9RHOB|nr:TenA family protein [Octadecabacter ascidiaceicola]SMX36778.1 Thiaminase-2 [Octadecabacter ascidiaceicola]
MSASQYLQSLAAEDWKVATHHAFTDALADGTLSQEKMAGYLQQDYLFVEGFVRLLGSAVVHAPTLADAVPAAQFLGLICGPENTYFLRSFEALEVTSTAKPAPETRALQELMDQARQSGRYEIMLSVLVVAEWIYLDWATPFDDRADDLPFWFGEWVTLHSGEGFTQVVAYLRGQLDIVWETLDDTARAEVSATFTQAVRLERAFFDASWAGFTVAK